MKKRMLLMFLMLLFAVAATSCSSSTNTAPSDGGYSYGSGQQTTTVNQSSTVNIENFSFNPQVLTITAGTTVTWTNKDSATHSIKSTDFSSPDMKTGETFQFKFEKSGTYDYTCGIHTTMTGKIIVQ